MVVVSVGQLSFDCHSYCRRSNLMQDLRNHKLTGTFGLGGGVAFLSEKNDYAIPKCESVEIRM